MEATSPKFVGAKMQKRSAAIASPLAANAPSVMLPLAFILVALAALTLGVSWLLLRPSILAQYHYNQHVIAATHLFVLGWICSVVMGAMYQLVPVALETKLYSEKLAWGQLFCHVGGFAGMVFMFRIWNMKQVGHFGCVMAVGVGLFIYNLARTLRRVPQWNTTATAVTAALFWFGLTILVGLSVAAGKCAYESTGGWAVAQGVRELIAGLRAVGTFMSRFDAIGAMHAHAHLGGIGLFTMLIVGVSYKLLPMFTLSEVQSKGRAAISVVLLNIGLAGAFLTIILRSPWKLLFTVAIIAALALYGRELRAILKARQRRTLDWGIKYFLTALGLLFPLSLLGIALSWPGLPLNSFTAQLENVYGFLGFMGVVSFAIIGMLYKIVPFLVWFGRYSRQIGKVRVPALSDLYSTRLQSVGYWTYLAGLAAVSTAIVFSNEIGVRSGCMLLAASVMTLLINVALVLSHFFKRAPSPLVLSSSVAIKAV